jgi:hypothetical protein
MEMSMALLWSASATFKSATAPSLWLSVGQIKLTGYTRIVAVTSTAASGGSFHPSGISSTISAP